MKGLKTVSVVDALATTLRARVLDGQIDAGVGLTEADVAAEYDVSRPTAKTAISLLVHEGLLRREPHKSAQVPALSRKDVEDLFLVRIPLELEVIRLVVGQRAVPAAATQAVLDLAALPVGAAHSTFVEADLRFHRALVHAVDSPRLTRLYAALSAEIHLSMVQAHYALGRDRIVAEHRGVLDALNRGEPDAAEALMRRHLEGARDALAEQFDTITERTAPA
jgi:DNA-binding GntR family transcriptional regulator